jgi:hypothetical protein
MKVDQISEQVAKELGLSPAQVSKINRVQWKFLLETMQAGDFKAVKLMYLGKWHKNKRFNEDGTRRHKGDYKRNIQQDNE